MCTKAQMIEGCSAQFRRRVERCPLCSLNPGPSVCCRLFLWCNSVSLESCSKSYCLPSSCGLESYREAPFPPGSREGHGTEASTLALHNQMILLHQAALSWLAMLCSRPKSTRGSAKPQRCWASEFD